MSLLNAWVSPERALIAVDTDGITPTKDHYEISKLLPLVHANTVFASRGDRRFVFDLFSRYYLASTSLNYDQIVAALPEMLASVIVGVRQEADKPFPYQVAVVGWSPAQDRVCGLWINGVTNEDGYDDAPLGARVAPWDSPERAPVPDSDEAIRAIAAKQVPWLQAKGTAGGGRLLVAEVTQHAMNVLDLGEL